jgi:hypothetical protein
MGTIRQRATVGQLHAQCHWLTGGKLLRNQAALCGEHAQRGVGASDWPLVLKSARLRVRQSCQQQRRKYPGHTHGNILNQWSCEQTAPRETGVSG